MSTVNANIADYLKQIESLTSTNLQILKTLNDSFFTKKNHLYAEIDDSTYVIPSFLSLENKINMLQENFENLVKSPETGEAYFNFDGNTRAIEVRKYNYTPDCITLPILNNYNIESNSIFKDFLTPMPYINIELPSLPNDITEVNVKKIVVKSDKLKGIFKNRLSYLAEITTENGETITDIRYHQSINDTYSNIYKFLYNYDNTLDYEEYDSIYKLPIRKSIGTGTYVIEKVISDVIDDDLNELITIKLRNNLTSTSYNNKLTYKLFDETIEKSLQVGDELVNYDGSGKVVITKINVSENILTVKVVNGEFLNFLGTDSYNTDNDNNIHDLSKLRFYGTIDFDSDKYVKVPLEEDQYIFIAVAPINNRLNIQSPWGTGIIIDTHSLTNAKNNIDFKTYYDNNVKNIGDILFELTSIISSPITSLSESEFNSLTTTKPVLNEKDLIVMQINKHLNNSITVNNIRQAYQQKKNAEEQLTNVQLKIKDINSRLSEVSFNDTNGVKHSLSSKLSELIKTKTTLINDINTSINEISMNLNSAEVPIDNAKYRIRGFYVPNLVNTNGIDLNNHVIGIQVQYRYKNISSDTGNATTITDTNSSQAFIYSDWNLLKTTTKNRIVGFENGKCIYKYEDNDEIKNEPSYNQIDIPISQGETVDIRLKVLYDFGQPYITITSDWSNIVSIPFPDEFIQDSFIKSIISENTTDRETLKINSVLEENGITSHIDDKLTDQNITYYHKADNIASGFYTNERKIIPLKDQLTSMVNDIAVLKDLFSNSDPKLEISFTVGSSTTKLYSDRENIITLTPFSEFNKGNNSNYGQYLVENGVAHITANISIKNTGNTVAKLYSLFPGRRDVLLNNTKNSIVDKSGYCSGVNDGVRYKYRGVNNGAAGVFESLQTQNQFITFRINDVWDGTQYYSATPNDSQLSSTSITEIGSELVNMTLYPLLNTKYGLCINSDEVRSYKVINPGEELIIPIHCSYVVALEDEQVSKTMSFDIRTNLHSDIVNYVVKVVGKYNATLEDKMINIIPKFEYTSIL